MNSKNLSTRADAWVDKFLEKEELNISEVNDYNDPSGANDSKYYDALTQLRDAGDSMVKATRTLQKLINKAV